MHPAMFDAEPVASAWRWRPGVAVAGVVAVALAGGGALAMPVALDGSVSVGVATDCSPWCGSSEARADVLGSEGQVSQGRVTGGGAAATSAVLGGGGFFGKTAAGTATFEWWAHVSAAPGSGSDPVHLFFDWDTTLFASHDAMLGQAAGGSEMKVGWYTCLPLLPGCVPLQTFVDERVYKASTSAGEEWDLGVLDPQRPEGLLHVTFDVGSMSTTVPWIGVYASAIDIGTFDFSLRADDGRLPPVPVPEPSTLAMLLATVLPGLKALSRAPGRRIRKAARPGPTG